MQIVIKPKKIDQPSEIIKSKTYLCSFNIGPN